MTYLFNTLDQQRDMLQTIGAASVDELFEQIPPAIRLNRPLNLAPAAGEMELERELRGLASRNSGCGSRACFLGGGVYDHFIPAAVDEIAGRGEFYTAYTPYQAEASQGSLQAFFEYQSLICRLTGMDVCNASLYEGGTAVSEAAFMAMRVTDRHEKIVVLGSVHPEYRQVLRTYLSNLKCELVVVPTPAGTADLAKVKAAVDDRTACLVFQHPNFFGCLEEPEELTRVAREVGALSVVSFDPISLGLLRRPGDYGADVAVAEGQPLGIPMQYGGPFLGVFTCRNEYLRKMPGRLVGRTTDRSGPSLLYAHHPGPRTAYSPREGDQQHLHEPGSFGAAGDGLSVASGTRGSPRSRRAVLPKGTLRRRAAVHRRRSAAGLCGPAVFQRVRAFVPRRRRACPLACAESWF